MSTKKAFLRLGDIKGESRNQVYPDTIEIDDYNFGACNTGSFQINQGGGTGNVKLSDFTCTKTVDSASPGLFRACASARHFANGTLFVCKSGNGQGTYLEVEFKDLIVSDYQITGSGGAEYPPTEAIRISFNAIKFKYCKQNNDGTLAGAIVAEFDAQRNVAR
jgi:type VI secretion system secreted protein Hcp